MKAILLLVFLLFFWLQARITIAEQVEVDRLEAELLESQGGPVISIDLDQAEVTSVLRLFSRISARNIVAAKGVAGKVSLRLNAVPFSQAFDLLLKTEELFAISDGSVTIVYPRDKFPELAKEYLGSYYSQ